MLMMDPSSPPAKLELKVRDIGLRVSPLPNDVRKRWLDWTAGSPPRSPSTLEVVEEKLQRAADRRKVQQERIVQQARSRPRALQRVPSGSRRRAQEQALADKLASAEQRREHHLNSRRQQPLLQKLGVESRRRALLWRRQRAASKLQQSWKAFHHKHKTTRELAQDFLSTGVLNLVTEEGLEPETIPENESPQGPSPFRRRVCTFEAAASCLQSSNTLKALKALLDRMEFRRAMHGDNKSDNLTEPLMRRLYPRLSAGQAIPHYHARVILSSVMICEHPDVVLNGEGPVEQELSAVAGKMLRGLRSLVNGTAGETSSPNGGQFFTQLKEWDDTWIDYLSVFVSWKMQDARALEQELIEIAVKMEVSRREKCGADAASSRVLNSSDLQGIMQQVEFDIQLLRDRIQKLTGVDGVERMEGALAQAKAEFDAQQRRHAVEESAIAALLPDQAVNDIDVGGGPVPQGVHQQTIDDTGGRSPTWAVARDSLGGMSNEAMVHEMLYNPGWQLADADLIGVWNFAKEAAVVEEPLKLLPALDMQELQRQGPQGASDSMRKHVALVAEQAFWDSVEAGLDGRGDGSAVGGGASPRSSSCVAERLAVLLAELGQEVIKVLPEQGAGKALAEELSASFSVPELLKVLTGSPSQDGVSPVGALLTQTASMMERLGSPGRSQDIADAQALIAGQFAAAAGGARGAPTPSRVTTRALRLLFAQMKLLKLDAANARLRLLSTAIAGGQALHYSCAKFGQRHGLPQEPPPLLPAIVADKLPNTARWLAAAAASAADTATALQAAGLDDATVAAAIASVQAAAPEGLRAGLRGGPASAEGGSQAPAVPRLAPVSPAAWQGQLRIGLVGLVTSEAPAVGAGMPETLELDARRLHSCQNELQRILVLSACMLLYQQAAGMGDGGNASEAGMSAVKERLSRLLLDGSPNLRDLAGELAAAAGRPALEEGLHTGLQRMLTPGSGPLQALRGGLGTALCLLLLFPRGSGGGTVAAELRRALSRCGGTQLLEDVKALAGSLAEVAAVTEAVHGSVYHVLLSAPP